MLPAAKGDIVTVQYTGKLSNGEIFDASPDDRPLQFVIGKKEVIPGFESAVTGMVTGEKRTVIIPAAEAYGQKLPERIEEIDRARLPEKLNPRVGERLEITGHDNSRRIVEVVAVSDQTLTLDGNHPLAGRDLTFDITMLEVVKQPKLF
ncbi:MAG: peptidylprolyl isomerase [Trichloromonas sp.]|jgi:peptidylprolyl isomerase|nr:peptidylprolyl isomerase [Trichloromonas sp.]